MDAVNGGAEDVARAVINRDDQSVRESAVVVHPCAAKNTTWRDEVWWFGTRQPLSNATGLPPEAYVSDAFFHDEQRQLFERAWVGIGLSEEVTRGRAIVRRVGQRSIIITRDGDGALRAFVNACRHRGTELMSDDCAIGQLIRCPYHRWGYRLDGSLAAAPRFNEVPRDRFDTTDYGLLPVRVGEWGGLVFACFDRDTPPLSTWLGDLPDRMGGYDLADWRRYDSVSVEIEANWKLITENFQEYYHLQWVHPELSKVSKVADHYRYQGPGMYCGQTTTPVSGDSRGDWLMLPPRVDLDESDRVSGRFVAIFPNIMLSVLPNHVFVMRLEPLASGKTREVCTWLLPPETMSTPKEDLEAAFASTRDFWLEVNNEDIEICKRSQRGLAFGSTPAGPLSPRFEEPLHRFHNIVAAHLLGDRLESAIPAGDSPLVSDHLLGTAPNPSPPLIETVSHADRITQ